MRFELLLLIVVASTCGDAAQFGSFDEVIAAIAQVESANPSWDAARILTGLRKLSYDSSSWDSLIADRAPIAVLRAGSSGLTELQVAQFADAAATQNAVPMPSTHNNDSALDIAHIWVGIEVVLFPRLAGSMAFVLNDYGSAPTATWAGDIGSAVAEHALSSTASCSDDLGCYVGIFSPPEDLLADLDGLAIGHAVTTGNYTGRLSWWLETFYSGTTTVSAAAAAAGGFDPDPVFQLGVLCRATLVARAQGWTFDAGNGVTSASIAAMRRQVQFATFEAIRRGGGGTVSEMNVNTATDTLVQMLQDIKASEPAACSAPPASTSLGPVTAQPTPAPTLAVSPTTSNPTVTVSLSVSPTTSPSSADATDTGRASSGSASDSMAVSLAVIIAGVVVAGAIGVAVFTKRRRSNFDGGQSRPNAFVNPTYGGEPTADERSAGTILGPDPGLILQPVPFGTDFLHANPNQPPWKTDFTSAEIHTV